MPIFISYSHSDGEFATRLAMQLVKHNTNVWIDQWELHVGDSLIDRIQSAVEGASAMLVILSKASVASEWCKKEQSAGLLRELEEKRVVVLPVLLEDCEIPLFLRGKKYADFRTDFDCGFRDVNEAASRFASTTLGRIDTPKWYIDWSTEWATALNDADDDRVFLHITMIQHTVEQPYTVLTEIKLAIASQAMVERHRALAADGLEWLHRNAIVEALASYGRQNDIRLLLEDEKRKSLEFAIGSADAGAVFVVAITSRRLGVDTGRNILLDFSGQLQELRNAIHQARRPPTADEQSKFREVSSKFPIA